MKFRSLDQLDCKGKSVLVRVNYDVSYADGGISDDGRLRKSLPTLRALLNRGAHELILLSHLGRPKGGAFEEEFSLRIAGTHLEKLIGEPVTFVPQWDLMKVQRSHLSGKIVLLENTRFSPGEKKNDPAFAKHLASLGECFVNDAFPAIHRSDASIVGIPKYLPAAAGLLVEEEIQHLKTLLRPEHPYIVLIAGKKADKIEAIRDLVARADQILIGGALASTFFKAAGKNIGASVYDHDGISTAQKLLEEYPEQLILPVDVTSAEGTFPIDALPQHASMVDIGPKTAAAFHARISAARTVLWCGPPGKFDKGFPDGTKTIAEAMREATKKGAYTVVGGGDSSEAAARYTIADKVSFNSTGGGATLEFARGKPLPGIVALEENFRKFR